MTGLVAGFAAGLAVWWRTAAEPSSTRRARIQPPRGSAWALGAVAAVAVLVGWLLLRLPLTALGALTVAFGIARVGAHHNRSRRRRMAVDADVVTFCFAVASEIRTGRMPDEAIAATPLQLGPLAVGVAAVARAVGHGAPVDGELHSLAEQMSSQRLATMAAVWAASATTGARVADVLDRLAHGFTAEDDSRADLDALAAGPRATAAVLCLLPLGGIALATVMGADPLALLLRSALGGLLLAVAALLDVCGVLWVRAVTARALRG